MFCWWFAACVIGGDLSGATVVASLVLRQPASVRFGEGSPGIAEVRFKEVQPRRYRGQPGPPFFRIGVIDFPAHKADRRQQIGHLRVCVAVRIPIERT